MDKVSSMARQAWKKRLKGAKEGIEGRNEDLHLRCWRCGGSVAGDKTKRCPALSLTFRRLGVLALLPSFNIAIKKR